MKHDQHLAPLGRGPRSRLLAACAVVSFVWVGLACGGLGRDCAIDGGGIFRAPRQVTAGGKTVEVHETYCTDWNDDVFEESVITVRDPGETSRRELEHRVRCNGIRIDTITVDKAGRVEFRSAAIAEPLVYDGARGQFSNNKDAWGCGF